MQADADAVRAHLAEVCAAFGKSEASRRLLTYLVDRHLAGEVPREIDIALDVFNRDASFDGAQDAVVRVSVRTLRQKLDEYYHGAGRASTLRLDVPKGGYRVVVTRPPAEGEPLAAAVGASAGAPRAAPVPPPRLRAPRAAGTLWLGVAVLGLSLLANAWLWHRTDSAAKAPATAATRLLESPVLRPLADGTRPLTIVLGDLLLFPAPNPPPGRPQLIRDPRINTLEQMREYLGGAAPGNPAAPPLPGMQVPTTLVPKSVAFGLVELLPLVQASGRQVEVHILDELPVDNLRQHDIVFMGPLVRLGPLEEMLFRGSRYEFSYGPQQRILRDRLSGQQFSPSAGRREQSTDFGLFASWRGPEGNRFMVFASVGSDLGLQPLMRSVTSADWLASLTARLTAEGSRDMPEEFEALMAVNGYYRTDLSAELLEAHARPVQAPAAVTP